MTTPMGLGVAGPKRQAQIDEEARKARILEHQATQEAARMLQRLKQDPLLTLLMNEMMSTMVEGYRKSSKGKAQLQLLDKLKISIDPASVAKIWVRDRAGVQLCSIADETQATP